PGLRSGRTAREDARVRHGSHRALFAAVDGDDQGRDLPALAARRRDGDEGGEPAYDALVRLPGLPRRRAELRAEAQSGLRAAAVGLRGAAEGLELGERA